MTDRCFKPQSIGIIALLRIARGDAGYDRSNNGQGENTGTSCARRICTPMMEVGLLHGGTSCFSEKCCILRTAMRIDLINSSGLTFCVMLLVKRVASIHGHYCKSSYPCNRLDTVISLRKESSAAIDIFIRPHIT
jgi:hypothetical protein